MNVRLLFAFISALVLPGLLTAQGFGGLGTSADGFALPREGTELSFPKDHAAHPEFRIEWWYVTANLQNDAGQDFGIQWTLFRSALAPKSGEGWVTPQLWMGHAAVTDATRHVVAERIARGGVGQAGVTPEPFAAFIDDWEMTSLTGNGIDNLNLTARSTDFSYDLKLVSDQPLVLHGNGGYSVKSREGTASYYYSQPAYSVTGTINLDGSDIPVSGQAWLDREWSSQPLAKDQSGWDWFSLSFTSGARVMAFQLRDSRAGFTSGTWIDASGNPVPLSDGQIGLKPLKTAKVAGRDIPVSWQVTLPSYGVDVTVEALNAQSWMATSIPYWEGPVRISGSHDGRGYLEMTGYE